MTVSDQAYRPGQQAVVGSQQVRSLVARGLGQVGVISCALCGAGLVLDPDSAVNVIEVHAAWHGYR